MIWATFAATPAMKPKALLAKGFLVSKHYPEETIATVINCILATRMPQTPGTKLERILCDADLIHLAEGTYPQSQDLLREAWRRAFFLSVVHPVFLQ